MIHNPGVKGRGEEAEKYMDFLYKETATTFGQGEVKIVEFYVVGLHIKKTPRSE